MIFSKFIVPIYCDNEFSGTGFIVNGFLVTANHVMNKKVHSYFVFENQEYKINIGKIIVLDEPENSQCSNNALDLFVCETDIKDSNLCFSSGFEDGAIFDYFGYSFDENTHELLKDKESGITLHRMNALSFSDCMELDNTFSCLCDLKPGNSGGPLFHGNKIVGMQNREICRKQVKKECVFIKASYIMDQIRDNNDCNI